MVLMKTASRLFLRGFGLLALRPLLEYVLHGDFQMGCKEHHFVSSLFFVGGLSHLASLISGCFSTLPTVGFAGVGGLGFRG